MIAVILRLEVTAKKEPQIKNWFYKWFALYILKQTVYSLYQNVDSLYQNVGGKSIIDFTNDSTRFFAVGGSIQHDPRKTFTYAIL